MTTNFASCSSEVKFALAVNWPLTQSTFFGVRQLAAAFESLSNTYRLTRISHRVS
jgi:hypothetical protein